MEIMATDESSIKPENSTPTHGVDVSSVIRQLRGIGGSNPVFANGARISSIPDAIAQVLERQTVSTSEASVPALPAEICPECSGTMKLDSGCYLCDQCGYSTC